MIQNEMQEPIDIDNRKSDTTTPFRRLITIVGLALVWAFIMAAIVGSLAAAIWTIIPTEILEWGASEPNLLGYISHCSFVPLSTFILSIVSLVGIMISWKLKKGREIAKGVFVGTAGGLLVGASAGIDIAMFIGMGAGIGVGVVLGILMGLFRRQSA
jgi:small-conductance mechanosensitive channel